MKKTISILTLSIFMILTLQACSVPSILTTTLSDEDLEMIGYGIAANTTILFPSEETLFTDEDLSSDYLVSDAISITLSDNASTSSSEDVLIDGDIITIARPGTYIIDGSLSDGQIVIEAFLSSEVQLVLNGVSISNSTSSPIYASKLDKLFITCVDGTESNLSANFTDSELMNATIFCEKEISFNGTGSLNINSTNGSGVYSNENIYLTMGTYNIVADNDGFYGVSSVCIGGGLTTVSCGENIIYSETEDNCVIIGGDFIGTTSSGTTQSFAESSIIGSIFIDEENGQVGNYSIYDANENSIIEFNAQSEFSGVLIASQSIDTSQEYKLVSTSNN